VKGFDSNSLQALLYARCHAASVVRAMQATTAVNRKDSFAIKMQSGLDCAADVMDCCVVINSLLRSLGGVLEKHERPDPLVDLAFRVVYKVDDDACATRGIFSHVRCMSERGEQLGHERSVRF
jgi:hypothetical protein